MHKANKIGFLVMEKFLDGYEAKRKNKIKTYDQMVKRLTNILKMTR